MKKLELKHLVPYLPYGLKGELFGVVDLVTGLDAEHGIVEILNNGNVLIEDFKPILRPLSYLTKEIEHNGERFVPIKRLHIYHCVTISPNGVVTDAGETYDLKWLPYEAMQILLQYHFDVFGLIDQGLAININDVK